jgi:hypothetical protein
MWSNWLGPVLLSKDGFHDTTRLLGNAQYVMIYVSAYWSESGREMTRRMTQAYMQRANRDTMVVFVSLDPTREQFEEHLQTMPWYAVPYEANRGDLIQVGEHSMSLVDRKALPYALVFSQMGDLVTRYGCDNYEHFFRPNAGIRARTRATFHDRRTRHRL